MSYNFKRDINDLIFHFETTYTDKEFSDIFILFNDVVREHKRQISKWGVQTHSIFEWLTYSIEELGELSKAISEAHYRDGELSDVYNEAIQTATLCLKIAEMTYHKMRFDKQIENIGH